MPGAASVDRDSYGREGGDDIEKELDTLRTQLKSGVEAIALPPSDLNVDEVKTVEIQEVEVELEEMEEVG